MLKVVDDMLGAVEVVIHVVEVVDRVAAGAIRHLLELEAGLAVRVSFVLSLLMVCCARLARISPHPHDCAPHACDVVQPSPQQLVALVILVI